MERLNCVTSVCLVLALTAPLSAATILHYNFEDGTPDTPMNPSSTVTGQIGSLDLSGNGYHMYAWSDYHGPLFSSLGETPTGIGLSSEHDGHRDGYCFADGLRSWSPGVWTIELSFKLDDLSAWRTLIGKDDWAVYNGANIDAGAALYIQKNGVNGAIRLDFATVSGERYHLDSTLIPAAGQWYHFAIVVEGDQVNMYADRLDGEGFQNAGTHSLTAGLNHALLPTGTWTFGRGWYNGGQADHIVGNLDDIRFSNVALEPSQFIHSRYAHQPDPPQNAPNVSSSQNTLSWTNRDDVDVCQVYFGRNTGEPNALSYRSMLTLIATLENPEKQSTVVLPQALAASDVCYWVVDSYRGTAPPAEPNLPGLLWKFTVNDNRAPSVDAGSDQGVWLGMNGNPGEATVTLKGTVTDDGLPTPPGGVTVAWTQLSGPTVAIENSESQSASATVTETGIYTFRLWASDGEFENSNVVGVYVGTNSCQASHMLPDAPAYSVFDADQDCVVGMADLAQFAAVWLSCSDTLTACE
ncbi:MAG: LamG domain-containing protein [Phycisphaerae bacterium]|nr:LamG domain-containing protein [Phycisphaerae bacterium]